MADTSQTPPPPYEADGSRRRNDFSEDDLETVPKYVSMSATTNQSGSRHNKSTSELKHRADVYNSKHSCTSQVRRNSRQNSTDQQRRRSQLIESLSATRRFFDHISIEPVAFLAILALYIEFPSIQDLIYTKICLQLVAENPNNFTIAQRPLHLTLYEPPPPQPLPSFAANSTNNGGSGGGGFSGQAGGTIISANLTTSGHIIDLSRDQTPRQPVVPNNQTTTFVPQTTIGYDYNLPSKDHLLCDRLNRTAVPANIRQQITDANSLFWLKYQVIICLLCALSCPYWGGMSDKIGRIIPLNVPIVAAAISNLMSLVFGLLISMNSHVLFNLNWLYVGAVLVGLSGGQAVLIISSFSFISDNTSSGSRSKRVTVLEVVIYLAHSVGFFTTKFIMRLGLESLERPWLNRHVVAFTTCVLLNLLSITYSLLKLRHQKFHRLLNNFEREQQEAFAGAISASTCSIAVERGAAAAAGSNRMSGVSGQGQSEMAGFASAERLRALTASTPDDLDGPIVRADRNWSGWSSFLTLKYYVQTYTTMTVKRESRSTILLLILCGFISAMALNALMSLLYIYLRSDPFYWTTSQYSSWNAITSITRGAALIALTLGMKFIKGWNVPDALVAALGFLSKGAGLLMIGLARDSTIIDWSLLAFVLSEYSMPPIRSLLSKLVVREEVGKIYSCLGATQSLCFLVGNITLYLTYTSLKVQDFFRLSFLAVAGLQIVAVLIMIYIFTTLRRRVIVV